jgi:hypothetical protein
MGDAESDAVPRFGRIVLRIEEEARGAARPF